MLAPCGDCQLAESNCVVRQRDRGAGEERRWGGLPRIGRGERGEGRGEEGLPPYRPTAGRGVVEGGTAGLRLA